MSSFETIINNLTVRMATDMETIDPHHVVKFYIFSIEIAKNSYNTEALKCTESYKDLPSEFCLWFADNDYLQLLLDIKQNLIEGAIYSLTHPDLICLN